LSPLLVLASGLWAIWLISRLALAEMAAAERFLLSSPPNTRRSLLCTADQQPNRCTRMEDLALGKRSP
jgi:hypothetical protein